MRNLHEQTYMKHYAIKLVSEELVYAVNGT